jgi:tetratricopeptide (TPR) repeat protein
MLYVKTFARLSLALAFVAFLQPVLTLEASAQSILPARPEAPGGGNPLEGLGRIDDPNPSRVTTGESDTANDGALPPEPDAAGSGRITPKKLKINKLNLIPPPSPVIPEGFSSADDKNPMKLAILHIGRKEYEPAYAMLIAIIKDDPQNLKAIYLEAVVLVHLKKYQDAEKSYKKILERSSDEDLRKMAELGLKKLDDLSSDQNP